MTDSPISNNPPPQTGRVAFVLKRATGEIEIRAGDDEMLWDEQSKHSGYTFGKVLRLSSTLVAIKGMMKDG